MRRKTIHETPIPGTRGVIAKTLEDGSIVLVSKEISETHEFAVTRGWHASAGEWSSIEIRTVPSP